MDCDYFIQIVDNSEPQDLTQVERIWMIEHIKECESCCKFIGEKIQNLKELDIKVIDLVELDKKIISS